MMAVKLKNCPLCGSKAEVKINIVEQVYCPNCGASTLWSPQARDHWNNRKRKNTNLKPCPICGGVGKVYEAYDGKYYVQCRKCGFTTGDALNSQAAQIKWNRRPVNES